MSEVLHQCICIGPASYGHKCVDTVLLKHTKAKSGLISGTPSNNYIVAGTRKRPTSLSCVIAEELPEQGETSTGFTE